MSLIELASNPHLETLVITQNLWCGSHTHLPIIVIWCPLLLKCAISNALLSSVGNSFWLLCHVICTTLLNSVDAHQHCLPSAAMIARCILCKGQ